LEGHRGRIGSLALSPDGKLLVSADAEGAVLLWDIETGVIRRRIYCESSSFGSVVFDPNGLTLWVVEYGGKIRGVPLDETKRQVTWQQAAGIESASCFRDKQLVVATAAHEGLIRVWNMQGDLIQWCQNGRGIVWTAEFSPDGHRIACGCYDGAIRIWKRVSNQRMRSEYLGEQGLSVYASTLDGAGDHLITSHLAPRLCRWNLRTGQMDTWYAPIARAGALVLLRDQETVAFNIPRQETSLFNFVKQEHRELSRRSGDCLTASSDGRFLAAHFWVNLGSPERPQYQETIELFDIPSVQSLGVIGRDYSCAAFAPQGLHLALGPNGRGPVRIYDCQSRRFTGVVSGEQTIEHVTALKYSPDGSLLAVRTNRGLLILNGEDLSLLIELDARSPDLFQSLAFSPDGKTLVSTGPGQWLRFWNIATGREVYAHHMGDMLFSEIAFSSDGRTLVVAQRDERSETGRIQYLDADVTWKK
jgi:WD40 repeat protein